jgi:hypothetical protein
VAAWHAKSSTHHINDYTDNRTPPNPRSNRTRHVRRTGLDITRARELLMVEGLGGPAVPVPLLEAGCPAGCSVVLGLSPLTRLAGAGARTRQRDWSHDRTVGLRGPSCLQGSPLACQGAFELSPRRRALRVAGVTNGLSDVGPLSPAIRETRAPARLRPAETRAFPRGREQHRTGPAASTGPVTITTSC